MPYLIASELPRESAGKRFRALLERPEILQLPGAHNGMAALQAKAADQAVMRRKVALSAQSSAST
jgi:methylisocitrate lyase